MASLPIGTMIGNTGFGIGQRVSARGGGVNNYDGTIVSYDPEAKVATIHLDDGFNWDCQVFGDKIASALGVWDNKTYLTRYQVHGDDIPVITEDHTVLFGTVEVPPIKLGFINHPAFDAGINKFRDTIRCKK